MKTRQDSFRWYNFRFYIDNVFHLKHPTRFSLGSTAYRINNKMFRHYKYRKNTFSISIGISLFKCGLQAVDQPSLEINKAKIYTTNKSQGYVKWRSLVKASKMTDVAKQRNGTGIIHASTWTLITKMKWEDSSTHKTAWGYQTV